jgi:DNA polymerase-3 subunit epsilon
MRMRGGLRIDTEKRGDDAPRKPCALARWLCRQHTGYVVWDTETTGLDDDAKIVSIGAVDENRHTILHTLVNPGVPIPPEATEIHGVTDEMVALAPTFEQVYPQIRAALHRRRWVVYNLGYDVPRLVYECDRYYLPRISPLQQSITRRQRNRFEVIDRNESYCAMEMFAEVYGAWSKYHESYTWQRLTTAAEHYGLNVQDAHHALGDALMTYDVLKMMALSEDKHEVG